VNSEESAVTWPLIFYAVGARDTYLFLLLMQMVIHYLSLLVGDCDGLLHQGFMVSVDFAYNLLLTFLVIVFN